LNNKSIKGELAFAGSLLILGVVVLIDTINMLVPPASGTIGPQIFPYLVSGFLILVSLGLIVQILRGNIGQPEGTEFGDTIDKTDFKTLLIVAGSMVTYPLLIERAGFIPASTLVFFGVSFAFGARNILKNLFVSLLFSTIVFFSFTRGLNVNLPSRLIEEIIGKFLNFGQWAQGMMAQVLIVYFVMAVAISVVARQEEQRGLKT
jgi:putative tricarboxylic transport membrane protein